MSLKNTEQQYGSLTKVFHWLVMILVIGMLIVGSLMGDIGDKTLKSQVFTLHKLTGLLVLSIGVLFLLWSLINTKPGYSNGVAPWEKKLARIVRGLLYFLLIAMPLSGWLMSSAAGYHPDFFGLFKIPLPGIPVDKALSHTAADLHEFFAWSLVALISLHALGALKHHFIDKNNILKRML